MNAPLQAPPREPLPTKEQVEAVLDEQGLRDMEAMVDGRAKKIEVDLEFRSDGDLDWERRARAALTAHVIVLGQIRKRIHRLFGGPQHGQRQVDHAQRMQEQEAAKLERQRIAALNGQTNAARKLAVNEAARLQKECEMAGVAAKIERQRLSLLEGLSWLGHFRKAAVSVLDAETIARIQDAATEAQTAAQAAAITAGRTP